MPGTHDFIQRRFRDFTPDASRMMRAHVFLASGNAMLKEIMRYGAFLSVRTFDSVGWSYVIQASLNFGNLVAPLVADLVRRTRKVHWVTWPNALAMLLLVSLFFVKTDMAAWFGFTIILINLVRTPHIPAESALNREVYPASVRSFAMSLLLCVFMLMGALHILVVGKVLEHHEHWVGPVYAATGVVGLGLVLTYFGMMRTVEVGKSEPNARVASLREQFAVLYRDPDFGLYELSFFIFGIGNIGMGSTLPVYLVAEFDASHVQGGLVTSIVPLLGSVLMLPLWGLILDRRNPLMVRAVLDFSRSLVPMLLYLTGSIWGVYLGVLVIGLMQGGGILVWLLGINYFARNDDVPIYMGLHQNLTGIRGIAVPFAAYALYEAIGARATMPIWTIFMATGTLILLFEVRKRHKLGRLLSYAENEALLDAS